MLLIIVGAGATYDSDWRRAPGSNLAHWSGAAKLVRRPPLAAHLFDEDRFGAYAARYRPSQNLMHRLRQAKGLVEPELEKIRDESKKQTQLSRPLLAA